MQVQKKEPITIETRINAPVDKVWEYWTEPEHIMRWNHANDDWHTTRAENDLRKGGKFSSRMEAKDGSMGFDFAGVYDEVEKNRFIKYSLGDSRKVEIGFVAEVGGTEVVESFDAESENSVEIQRQGWQSILDNFKKYVETREGKSLQGNPVV